jgi:hypothetical protein
MRITRWFVVLAAAVSTAGLAVATLQESRVTERPNVQDQGQTEGVEVQVRGEVHEAFAQPSVLIQKETQIIPKQPPELVNELPPDQKPEGDNVFWIPGYWSWDIEANNFLWVSGVWRSFPPDHEWVPGYWTEASGGWRWVSGYWSVTTSNDVDLLPQPPELIEENVPPARDESSTWVPGNWVYKESRYWWRPGYWVALRPGWVWTPAIYYWTPGGYIFIDGFWDHAIERRGLVFAPVIFDTAVIARRDFVYRPSFVVSFAFLESSLFVNVNFNRYYFGDWYDAGFERRGFVPWTTWRVHGRIHDPLFTAWRFNHRNDADRIRRIEGAFATARTNRDARPVRTLADLRRGNVNQVFQNSVVAINNVTNINQNIRMTQVDRSTVSRDTTQRFRTLATERQRNEVRGAAGRTARDAARDTGRDARDTRDARDARDRDAGRDVGRDARDRDMRDRDARDRDTRERDARDTTRERDARDTTRDRTVPPGRDRDTGRDTVPPTGRDRTVPPGRDTLPPGRDRDTGRDTVPPTGRDRTAPPGRDTVPPGRDTTPPGRDTLPPGRDTTPPGRDRTVPPGRDTLPPGRDTTPPGRDRTMPPGKDTTPPGRSDANRDTPPNRGGEVNRGRDAGSTGNRYQRPRSEQNYSRPTGDKAPPPRPEVPQPQQRGSQADRDRTPGKDSTPAKERNPGRDAPPAKERNRDKDR